ITLYGDLPARCYSHVRARQKPSTSDPIVTFDIDIFDDAGTHLISIAGLSLRRISDPSSFGTAPAREDSNGLVAIASGQKDSGTTLGHQRDRISSREGEQAFKRVLAGARGSKLVVFPSDFAALNEQSRRPQSNDTELQTKIQESSQQDEIETILS